LVYLKTVKVYDPLGIYSLKVTARTAQEENGRDIKVPVDIWPLWNLYMRSDKLKREV